MTRRFPAAHERALDLVAMGENSLDSVWLVDSLPATGAKIRGQARYELPGGQVATAALAARRLGARVHYQGAVGDDGVGERALSGLAEQGVGLSLRHVGGGRSRSALVMIDQHAQRTIVTDDDSSVQLGPEDLSWPLIESCRALHLDLSSPRIVKPAMQAARKAGAMISLDVDAMEPGTLESLALVDVLVLSENVLGALGCSAPSEALSILRRSCGGLICITAGERGSVALWEQRELRVPAFRPPVLRDTTGCGDVFRAALLMALLEGQRVEAALRFASAAGALQAGGLGAQGHTPRREAIEALLRTEPPLG